MSKLFLSLLQSLVAAMAAMLTPTQVKAILDRAFDEVEDKVKATSNQYDDAIVLPMVTALRTALNIPDNDEAAETTETE